jgi:hypothetical protein
MSRENRTPVSSMKGILAIGVAAAITGNAYAGWVTGMTIRNVRSQASTGAVTFATVEPIANPSNCGLADFYGIQASDNPKQGLAILLAAQASGAKVNFYIPAGTAGCESNGRPHVTDVMIGTF